MLSTEYVSGFQGSIDSANAAVAGLGQVEDVPELFVDRYKLLELAANSIRNAHTQLLVLIQSQGGVDPQLIAQYNDALQNVRVPVERAVEEKNEVVKAEGAGPGDEVPQLPPAAVLTSRGGLGFVPVASIFRAVAQAPGFVPATEIRFTRSGQLGTIDDAVFWDRMDREREAQLRAALAAELGLAPLVVVAVIAAVAFIGWQVAKTFRTNYTETSKQEASRAEAEVAEASARIAEAITGTQQKVFAKCAESAKNADQVLACADKAAAAARAAGKAAEEAKPRLREEPKPPLKGLGVFAWIGIVTTVSVAAVGGYLIYRRVRARRAMRAPAMMPALPEPAAA